MTDQQDGKQRGDTGREAARVLQLTISALALKKKMSHSRNSETFLIFGSCSMLWLLCSSSSLSSGCADFVCVCVMLCVCVLEGKRGVGECYSASPVLAFCKIL